MLPIITAEERSKEFKGVKGIIYGKAGIGKTSLLWTLPEDKTLYIDIEKGDIAVKSWGGDFFRPETWQDCQDLACFISGYDKSLKDDQIYSKAHYESCVEKYGDANQLDKYDTIFIDSVTRASKLCFNWAKGQPEAWSKEKNAPNMLGAYGLLGQNMVNWVTRLQHSNNKNVFLICLLDEYLDDFKRKYYSAQVDGEMLKKQMDGIVDEVITMAEVNGYRAFITQTINDYGYPAKDRSDNLSPIEEPNLYKLIEKCKLPSVNRFNNIKTTIPTFLNEGE